jgi:hypothetical protein
MAAQSAGEYPHHGPRSLGLDRRVAQKVRLTVVPLLVLEADLPVTWALAAGLWAETHSGLDLVCHSSR